MSSTWPSTLASLDQDLALLCDSLEKLEAAESVDVGKVVEQLKATAAVSVELRGLVLAELPDASWQDRKELQALLEEITRRIEAREEEQRRSSLLALAAELERGNIVHRRAVRVTQLSELRQEAIEELRSFARLKQRPPTLPGPDTDRWMQWACGLKEPEDADSLQALRTAFPWLDEFVANLEPGMWVTTLSQAATGAGDAAPAAIDVEQRRVRLLALADELERGNIVHHRGSRVTHANQLRDQAVEELRSHAQSQEAPPALPGPEADQWIEWACNLKEPDDTDFIQSLRNGFVHLDEFVSNLEPGMWVKPAPTTSQVQREPESSAEIHEETREPEPVEPVFVPAPAFAAEASAAVKRAPAITFHLPPRIKELWQRNSRMVMAGAAVLVLVLFATILLLAHRRHTSNTSVSAVQAAVPEVTPGSPVGSSNVPSSTPGNSGTRPAPEVRSEKPKPTDQNATPLEKPVKLLDNTAALRTPQAIPGRAALRKADDASAGGAPEAPSLVPALPTAASNGLSNIMRDVPVAQPKVAEQKIRVSSGVAQGQLIHQVTPQYPGFARTAGIRGTVVLQAVIAKDGTVKNLQVLRGPPALAQPAMDAVKQWRYKPFSLNGEPAEADIQINVNFEP